MSNPTTTLPSDTIDDLIYACRTSALDELSEILATWSKQMNTSEGEIIRRAIDLDEEGNGSRACLLHYPAANGNLEITTYLLGKIGGTQTGEQGQEQEQVNGGTQTATASASPLDTTTSQFINHQNDRGNTALHWAALNGHLDVVKVLVAAGADPTIVNVAGRDAVVEAEYSAVEKAGECAVWLLRECEGLEKGTGGGLGGDDEEEVVMVAGEVDGEASGSGSGKVVNGGH